MKKPILEYKNTNQLLENLQEWQERLGLSHWAISAHHNCAPDEMIQCNVAGECEWQEVNKSAVIRLADAKLYGRRILKYCAEKTLVHELLHIKLCMLGESGNRLQDRIQHQIIEDMAKVLIAAKYNLSLKWFEEDANA